MRLSTILTNAVAACALAVAGPASAATVSTFIGPGSGSATTNCSGDVGGKSGSVTVHGSATCTRADVGEATGVATASVGHVGATAVGTSHTSAGLPAAITAEATYSDAVVFTSIDPTATSADVSLKLLLDGVFGTAGPSSAGFIEGRVSLGAGSDFFQIGFEPDGLHVVQNSFFVAGGLGAVTNAVLTTHAVHVTLNEPVFLQVRLQSNAGAIGAAGFAQTDFGGSFKFPTDGVFILPDGVTANAGDYLVDNRFIDPLAPAQGVPEPAAWALMLLGFGFAGSSLRRVRADRYG
jgi:hypothetical protein